ncbi:hypothetical protein ACMD2_14607 [Ananas comosus]|uniref:Chaperonin-like RbcX protein 2, chloroplastic n=1 Tax=Ananas comosus TaxID=4615 RepID=A0A199W6W5_ANACO|nr:hypothetical protein ACMD2_14607 [Ananas comosus]
MAGAGGGRSMAIGSVAAAAVDTFPSAPCLCVDALCIAGLSFRGRGKAGRRPPSSLEMSSSSFLGAWNGRRPSSAVRPRKPQRRSKRSGCAGGRLLVVDDLGGQYEEGFEDVHAIFLNFNSSELFVAANKPTDGKRFLQMLGKERQELAERVMITRLHLYGLWIKKLDHAKMYQKISDENLQLMRERLMETVIWPTDDTNTEKIG